MIKYKYLESRQFYKLNIFAFVKLKVELRLIKTEKCLFSLLNIYKC